MDEQEELNRKQMVGLLSPYINARTDKRTAEQQCEHLADLLKRYLEAHPGEELWDGEHKIRAFLQERRGSGELDAMNLAKSRPDLLTWAAAHGLLKLDTKAYQAFLGKAPEMLALRDFVSPGSGSVALRVEEDE